MKQSRKNSIKKILSVAFAYVGIITGAGLATGREIVQYFVSFGSWGIVGIVTIAILFMLFGDWILSLGSLFQANSHVEVFDQTTHPVINKVLDSALTVSTFIMSVVMIAGAGSSFSQQFDVPAWIGSLICAGLILLFSYTDFEKVTAVLGGFTPLILILLLIGLFHVVTAPPIDWPVMFERAAEIPTTLPNTAVSIVNYIAMNLMFSTSMLFVLGGQTLNIKDAQKGGVLGGFFVGMIGMITAILIYSRIDVIGNVSIPMLSFMREIHPIFAWLTFVVIFGMTFNTGFSVSYSLGKRIAGDDDKKFKKLMPLIVGITFLLSLFGFSDLMAVMYPLLGYIGILLLGTIAMAKWSYNKHLAMEKTIREELYHLIGKRQNSAEEFTAQDDKRVRRLVKHSFGSNSGLYDQMETLVKNHQE